MILARWDSRYQHRFLISINMWTSYCFEKTIFLSNWIKHRTIYKLTFCKIRLKIWASIFGIKLWTFIFGEIKRYFFKLDSKSRYKLKLFSQSWTKKMSICCLGPSCAHLYVFICLMKQWEIVADYLNHGRPFLKEMAFHAFHDNKWPTLFLSNVITNRIVMLLCKIGLKL